MTSTPVQPPIAAGVEPERDASVGPVTPEILVSPPDKSSLELVSGIVVEKPASKWSSQTELIIGSLLLTHATRTDAAEVSPAGLGYRVFPDTPNEIRDPDASIVLKRRPNELIDPKIPA